MTYVRSKLVHSLAIILLGAAMILSGFSAFAAEDHKITFMDPMWDGKTIPDKQQCPSRGAGVNPHTPKLKITNLPAGTKYLLMVITDENYGRSGDHGIFRLKVPSGATEVIFPRIYQLKEELPSGVTIEKGNRWGMGVGHYIAPCSGGKNNNYYSDIIPYGEGDKKLGENYIDWGRY